MMHVEEMCSQNKTGQYVDAKQYLSSGSAKAQVTVQPYRNRCYQEDKHSNLQLISAQSQ